MDASIVIVNWNTGALLRQCLDSLGIGFINGEGYEVLVIDNDSSDQSIAIAEGSPQVFQQFLMKKNLGFARANNVGIRQAQGDYIILLNPDTVVTAGAFSRLIDFCKTKEGIGAVGPRLLNTDLSWQPSCRRFPNALVLGQIFLKVPHFFPNLSSYRNYLMKDFIYENATTVDQIMGACMVIPKKAFEKIGLLDEKYWIWFEEVDWCKRAQIAKMDVWFTPSAEIIHHGGVSFKQAFLPVRKEWRFMRSALRYTRLHLGVVAWLYLLVLAPIGLLFDSLTLFIWLKQSKTKKIS